jgi:hypothetical protein
MWCGRETAVFSRTMSIGLIVTRSQCRFYSVDFTKLPAGQALFWRGGERVNLEQMALKVTHYRSCMAAHRIVTAAEFER